MCGGRHVECMTVRAMLTASMRSRTGTADLRGRLRDYCQRQDDDGVVAGQPVHRTSAAAVTLGGGIPT
jgi:hypothetical protein